MLPLLLSAVACRADRDAKLANVARSVIHPARRRTERAHPPDVDDFGTLRAKLERVECTENRVREVDLRAEHVRTPRGATDAVEGESDTTCRRWRRLELHPDDPRLTLRER